MLFLQTCFSWSWKRRSGPAKCVSCLGRLGRLDSGGCYAGGRLLLPSLCAKNLQGSAKSWHGTAAAANDRSLLSRQKDFLHVYLWSENQESSPGLFLPYFFANLPIQKRTFKLYLTSNLISEKFGSLTFQFRVPLGFPTRRVFLQTWVLRIMKGAWLCHWHKVVMFSCCLNVEILATTDLK